MNHTEHTAKSASTPKTGPFATLRAHLRRATGSGAPSTGSDRTSAPLTASVSSLGNPHTSRLELRPSRRAEAKDAGRAMKRAHMSVRERIGLPRTLASALLGAALLIAPAAAPNVASAQAACPNEQLRLEDNATNLPGCRSYERVSPPGKTKGGPLYYQLANQSIGEGQSPMQATPVPALEGDAIVYYRRTRLRIPQP